MPQATGRSVSLRPKPIKRPACVASETLAILRTKRDASTRVTRRPALALFCSTLLQKIIFLLFWNIHSNTYLCTVDKREQILLAAMELLIENGVQATPMSAIARAANTGMGTIYNYFATKEELINAIYIYIKQDEIKVISESFAGDSIKRHFEQFYGQMIRYFIAKPRFFLFMDQFNSSPILTAATKEEGLKAFGSYIGLLKKGQEQGLIKPISIEELMQFLSGGLTGFVRWLLATGKPLTQALLDNQLRIAWDAIKE